MDGLTFLSIIIGLFVIYWMGHSFIDAFFEHKEDMINDLFDGFEDEDED